MQPVAIVGLAARLPGAWDIDEFWDNLRAGREAVTFYDHDELRAAGVSEAVFTDPRFVPAESALPGADEFDAPLFGMTPREARVADPQIRLALEVCHGALENAGCDPFRMPGPVSVFASVGMPTYLFANVNATADPSNQSLVAMLNNGDYAATQVSYRFNLTGPAMTVTTACSSSLTAVHLAVQSLNVGECRAAVAAGVCIEVDVRYGYFSVSGGVRSPDGHCRPFDVSGGGTVFGNGAGAVVLKRLDDALADGDHIYAVIRGVGINNDGNDKVSYIAPSQSGQVGAIRLALESAGVVPADISYVEAHATGTTVGDPLEVSALVEAWTGVSETDLAPESCGIGSVKSNVGHMAQAAGVASLIKLALSLDREVIPPSINVVAPIKELSMPGSPFVLADSARPWPRDPARPRRAAVSSFGAGGTNLHMILEEGPAAVPSPATARARVIPWSGASQAAADAAAPALAAHLESAADYEDSVTTLQRGRSALSFRRAVVAADPAGAATALREGRPIAGGRVRPGGFVVVWAFPGQGSLQPGTAVQLAEQEPLFAQHLRAAFALFGQRADELEQQWRHDSDPASVARTGTAQPILLAIELALADTLSDWNLRPDIVTGHSVGELVAATVAGVIDRADAAQLVLARADAMQAMPSGSMAAVFAGIDDVTPLLTAGMGIAAVNGAREVVVAGPDAEISGFLAASRAAELRSTVLRTSHAFHSPSMAPAQEQFRAAFDGRQLHRPSLTLVSASHGGVVDEQPLAPGFWSDQLTTPVRFDLAVDALVAAAGPRPRELVVLEIGPGEALRGMIAGHEGARAAGVVAAPLLPRPRAENSDAAADVRTALATAWTRGVAVDWAAVDAFAAQRRVPVPGYPYQRERHWIDGPLWMNGSADRPVQPETPDTLPELESGGADSTSDAASIPATTVEVTPAPSPAPFATLTWTETNRPAPAAAPETRIPALVLLPADRAAGRSVLLALQQARRRVIAVRPGDAYAAREHDFTVDPTRPDDLARVLAAVAEWDEPPVELVHAATLGRWPQVDPDSVGGQLESSLFTLLTLFQATGNSLPAARTLTVFTSQSADVSGSDPLDPVKAAMHGLVRTAVAESTGIDVRLIDLDDTITEDDLVDEILVAGAEPVVALRGTRRWTRREATLVQRPTTTPALRRKGVYLITGGLGGLGLELARGLAGTGLQPTIVLIGRTAPDQTAGDGRSIADELADLGADVKVMAADIADPRAVARTVDIVAARHGAINGVFHLAGVPGDGVMLLRERAAVEAVLRPKVLGTLALHAALSERHPLDFWVNFASRAGVDGLVGSGDYAAANAFLDAWAAGVRTSDTRVLSVDWPSWHTVGMAVPGLQAEQAKRAESGASATTPGRPETSSEAAAIDWGSTFSPSAQWELDEHRLNGVAVLPGAGQVDLVIRAARETFPDAPPVTVISDLAFAAALTVPDELAVRVHFHRPDGRGAGTARRFDVQTRQDDEWITHSSGLLDFDSAGPVAETDLDELSAAFADQPDEADESEAPGERSFVLGPRWDNLESVRTRDDERLVTIQLPLRFAADTDEHPMHPAMLDSATSSARLAGDGLLVPFVYQQLRLYRSFGPRLISHVRRTKVAASTITADIDLYAPDGAVVGEIRGFTMRRFEPSAFLAAGAAGVEGAPEHRSRTAAPDRSGATARGIAPAAGVKLMLELLDLRTPTQVLVRPHEGGVPVALPNAAELAAAVSSAAPAPTAAAVAAPVVAAVVAAPAQSGASVIDRLRTIWGETLGTVDIEDDDEFFDIGGSSLSAIELIGRVRDEFDQQITVVALLEAPSLASMAAMLESSP